MPSKTPQPPHITVVVITRNRAGILGDCLQSMVEQDLPNDQYELVVVDDGSTDGTPAVVKSFQANGKWPYIRCVTQPHRGVNAARNNGIQHARGTVVAFLDDDVLAPPDYLARVQHAFVESPHLDGLGGPLRDYGGTALRTCNRCSLAETDVPGEGIRAAPVLIGGNMALRASAFQRAGLFDGEISGRGDETEWFHRADGLNFLYNPDLWVWHRRDNFNLAALCRHSFIQGLSVPLAKKKAALRYRPNPSRIGRPLAHALRYGCAWGLVLAFREMGSVIGYFKLLAAER